MWCCREIELEKAEDRGDIVLAAGFVGGIKKALNRGCNKIGARNMEKPIVNLLVRELAVQTVSTQKKTVITPKFDLMQFNSEVAAGGADGVCEHAGEP